MPTTNHTITVEINGIDRSSKLLGDSLYIKTSVGNKGDVATFVVQDDADEYTPADWDEVVISVNGIAVFGGYITSRAVSGVGSGSSKVAQWDVECRDWSALLDTVVVQYSAVDLSDADILHNLFDAYLQVEAFDVDTYVNVVDDDVDITFEYVTVRKALDMLAEVAGAEWHIAPDKSLYWYSPTAPENAAFNIDVVAPDNETTFDVLAGSLNASIDSSTIINHVRVFGGEEAGDKVTDNFAADGVSSVFGPLTSKPGSVWKVTFTLGGVLNTNFADRIGYEPEDRLSIDGGDYNTLVNLENRYIEIKKTDGSVPDNGTTVSVTYYTLIPVDVEVESQASQDFYGRTFTQTFYDDQLTSRALATGYAERVLDEYAFGRETIRFSVTEHGLLPGRLISVNAPVLGVESTYNDALALESYGDVLLLEDGTSRLMLENYGEARKFLIQDVSIRTVVTGANTFMVVATVSAGKYIPTIIDSLASVPNIAGNVGRLPAKRTVGRLDHISNDLGEIVAGRATFTDGGTAPFTWDAYNDHTGVVIGLEEDGSNAYGAMYILDDGVVKAKVGRMNGLSAVGGVTPTGWGIWTENGYFSGVIAASQMIGGTVATTTMPINSSNPGVYMTAAGLFAYGTLGLTFSLPSNPALAPYFSSGTINNVVYEVYESGIIRTSGTPSSAGGVQIDDSGIFAYATPANGGGLKFSVDANTGLMTATGGSFTGIVSASQITGGTVTGSRVSGGTVVGAVFTGGTVTQGTVSAAAINGGTVTGSQISGGTVTGGLISGGTVSGALLSGGTLSLSSGTLTISAAGINNNQTGTAGVYSDTSPLFTRLNTNGTVLGYTGMYVSNVTAYGYTRLGRESSPFVGGEYEVRVAGGPFAAYDYIRFVIDGSFGVNFNFEGTKRFEVSNLSGTGGSVVVGYNTIPSSSNAIDLGDSTHAYRYLYLHDGTDEWRIAINSSGVLTTTKV